MTATPRGVPPTCVCVTYISFIPVRTSRSSCVVGERQKKKKRDTPCSKADDVSGLWNVIAPNSSHLSSVINHHGIGETVKSVWLTDTLCKICSISSLHVKTTQQRNQSVMKAVITCSDTSKIRPCYTLHKDKHGVCVTWLKQQHRGSKAFLWQSAKHGSATCEPNKYHQSIFLSSSSREKIMLKSQAQINWVSNWTRDPHDSGPPWWPLI